MPLRDEVAAFFRKDGPLSTMVDGYRPRNQQIAMAAAVADTMDAADMKVATHLAVDAPTGVGKSFAYLVPAFAYCRQGPRIVGDDPKPVQRRVLVVTSSLNLMDQLQSHDLPALAKHFPGTTWAVVKGTSNYLCRLKYDKHIAQIEPGDDPDLIQRIDAWAETTTIGDVSELGITPGRLWSRYSTSGQNCRGNECAWFSDCFAAEAKRRASTSHIVVANYHLVMTLAKKGSSTFLQGFSTIICDEAHHIGDIARTSMGFRFTSRGVASAVKFAEPATKKAAKDETDRLFNRILSQVKEGDPRIRRAGIVDGSKLRAILERAKAESKQAMTKCADPGEGKDRRVALADVADIIYNLRCAETIEGKNQVYYVEFGDMPALCAALVSPGPTLADRVWKNVPGVVLTSATLATGGSKPFSFIISETGISRTATTLSVPSPFNYSAQCRLIVPAGLPEPKAQEFTERVSMGMALVCKYVPGRILCLFTSYKAMKVAAEHIRKVRSNTLVQGEKSRQLLVDEFKADENAVLLGTDSFWTGVDVPGMKAVLIDKIPFPTPSDPVMDALKEKDPKTYFYCHYIPRAVAKFRQGFGRLVRRVSDRGIVVAFDPRLWSGWSRYSSHFLGSLPHGLVKSQDLKDGLIWVGKP